MLNRTIKAPVAEVVRLWSSPLLLAAFACLAAGCQPAATNPGAVKPGEAGRAEHAAAPHGGHLIELGEEEYHAELVDDSKTGTVTIYLLGSDAKTPVAGDEEQVVLNFVVDAQPKQFVLKTAPGSQRDQFTAQDAELMKALDSKNKTPGRLNVKIKGKSYVGAIEHSHDDHH